LEKSTVDPESLQRKIILLFHLRHDEVIFDGYPAIRNGLFHRRIQPLIIILFYLFLVIVIASHEKSYE